MIPCPPSPRPSRSFVRPAAAVVIAAAAVVGACARRETSSARPTGGDPAGGLLAVDVSGAAGRVSLDGGTIVDFTIPELAGCPAPRVEVSPAGEGWRRVRATWTVPADVRQDDLAIRFTWPRPPEAWWAPHLAPEPGFVIAQHVFRSPAVIARGGGVNAAIVPDLDLVGRSAANPWYLDVDAPASEARVGMTATEIPLHVLYRRAPGMTFARGEIALGFFVSVWRDGGPVPNPWSPVAAFLWERWGRPLFARDEPLRAPIDRYVRHTYDWAFRSWKPVWQEFDLDGARVGAPQFIVNVSQSPNSPLPWFQREFLSIWNQAWFSSLRSASGVYRYARRVGDETLMSRAVMTKELALAAPVDDGLFPSVYRTDTVEVVAGGTKLRRPRDWSAGYWTNSDRSPRERGIGSDWYHVLDMSWTALLMLRWHRELEADPRLLAYASAYGDRLLKLQDAKGFFPGWLHPQTHLPGPVMNQTPETSLSATFLLALSRATGRPVYRDAGLRAVEAVLAEIVPAGRWEDFETFWSCSDWGVDDRLGRPVERNAMYKQNTLSMFWTAEALLSAFRETRQVRYLRWGRRCLDELSMAQQVWQPPFIHVPALGGFGVMNCDGEWNDSRETLFAPLFLDYYRETGDPALFERGTAALRAGFVMMYCPENPRVRAMWEKVYPWFGPADYGFTMENYGHGGRTTAGGEGMGSFTIYDWGNGAAAEAANRVRDLYGQVYADRARGRAFGLDLFDARFTPGGALEVTDRAGGRADVRIVYEDGSAETRLLRDGRVSVPARGR